MRIFSTILFIVISYAIASAQLKSPDEFLPHKLGEHFTPHHLLVDYFQHVAANSPLVELVEYGHTNQDRPLMVAIVTSEANHTRLDEIRLNNLRMTGMETGQVNPELSKAIVWLSFSVHGNEAAGSESSYQVLYDLVNPSNTATKKWLENTVVIIDPSINPDGYSRYTHWVRNVTGAINNTDINDIEHNEPWPGGRTNHYLFDLNRDWAWQTQIESQQRLKLYHQWLPHVHADLHEMGYQSPYYFAPAAKPYHNFITKWQRDFQETIGKNHAKYFDKEGWLYFTKEVFDLFYPSYGDTYPTYSGAIGMTYEQGGGGTGGRGVELKTGEILTLKDRIDHHKTTALSTVEISSLNKDALLTQFRDFYQKSSSSPVGKYKTYILKKDKSGQRLKALSELLDKQMIQYGTVSTAKNANGIDYQTLIADQKVTLDPGDMVISAYQPKSILTQILFDPESQLEDSLTYDITAWSLPYAYGLQAFATESKIMPDEKWSWQTNESMNKIDADTYALVIPWTDLESSKAAAWLAKNKISARVSTQAINNGGNSFAPGSLIITKADNRSKSDNLASLIEGIKDYSDAQIIPLSTGFADKGPDLGSGRIDLLKKPKILSVMGEGVSSLSYGQVKWYFDQVIKYPLTIVDINRFDRVNLSEYNTIVLPEGRYSMMNKSKLSDWVRDGGKLIAIGYANNLLVDDENFALKQFATDDDKTDAKKANTQAELSARYNHYSEEERLSISEEVPGAIFKLSVDNTHPLGYGLEKDYFSLRTNNLNFPLMVNEANVIRHPKDETIVLGFAGSEIKKKLPDTVAFAVESKGRGTVIYMVDNPLFRGFWYNGLFLFSNAVFLVN